MVFDRKPGKISVNPSEEGTSEANNGPEETQLSGDDGVNSDVGSVAIDRGMFATGAADGAGETDADVMLRVKAGDDAAFEYLVQKYRRPMVNFMYRMAHNAAAAEDLGAGSFFAGIPFAGRV